MISQSFYSYAIPLPQLYEPYFTLFQLKNALVISLKNYEHKVDISFPNHPDNEVIKEENCLKHSGMSSNHILISRSPSSKKKRKEIIQAGVLEASHFISGHQTLHRVQEDLTPIIGSRKHSSLSKFKQNNKKVNRKEQRYPSRKNPQKSKGQTIHNKKPAYGYPNFNPQAILPYGMSMSQLQNKREEIMARKVKAWCQEKPLTSLRREMAYLFS